MAEYLIQDTTLKEITDAIRGKTGKSDLIKIQDAATEIETIPATVDYVNVRLTTIPPYTYAGDTRLKSVSFSNVTAIEKYAFSSSRVDIFDEYYADRKSVLEYANFPNVTEIDKYAFFQCDKLSSIDLPNVQSILDVAFGYCTSLKSITLPKVAMLSYNVFAGNSSLEEIVCGTLATSNLVLSNGVFNGCSNLHTIVIGNNSGCANLGNNVFNGTPIAAGNGSIYVPDNLVEQYKANASWSAYASQIKPLSEYSES